MAAFGSNPGARRIVRTRPGSGTGDTIYTDDRGQTWISTPGPINVTDETVPPMTGVVVGGVIIPR